MSDDTTLESMDYMKTRHQKELKTFEGEKRSAIKKIKGTAGKGKKGKELIAQVEQEYDDRFKAMQERHTLELSTATEPSTDTDSSNPKPTTTTTKTISTTEETKAPKKSKAQKKREKARAAEKQRELEIAKERLNAGPSPRQLEIQRITELYLMEKKLTLREIPADGNCLYRAIASQCQNGVDYKAVRKTCAEVLTKHNEEFSPFAEIETTYEKYVENVASSSEWGGHLELRALAMGLKRPIVVYSADAPPLVMGEEFQDEEEIRLSFHRYYYALGEHYNSVVPIQ